MSTYIRKTDSVLEPADNAATLKRRLYATQQCMDQITRAMKSFGLSPHRASGSATQIYFLHAGLKSCRCGRAPRILEDPYAEGTWAVFCPECVLSTPSHKRILDAMKDWQAGRYTEDTEMIQRPLTRAEDIADSGAEALLGAIRAQAADDYVVALQTGRRGDREIEEVFPERSGIWKRMFEQMERDEQCR